MHARGYSSGVIRVGMEGEQMDALELPPMVEHNKDPKGNAFGVLVDATEEHGESPSGIRCARAQLGLQRRIVSLLSETAPHLQSSGANRNRDHDRDQRCGPRVDQRPPGRPRRATSTARAIFSL